MGAVNQALIEIFNNNCFILYPFRSAFIKIASIDQDLFWVTYIGQMSAAIAQVFMLNLPPIFTAAWFGDKEV